MYTVIINHTLDRNWFFFLISRTCKLNKSFVSKITNNVIIYMLENLQKWLQISITKYFLEKFRNTSNS